MKDLRAPPALPLVQWMLMDGAWPSAHPYSTEWETSHEEKEAEKTTGMAS